ncbi:sensor domain-containing diguanylate cyclase [Pseudoduganella namucuonensis]|uniref:PAS domain S-box-containing protein/diguanylate cyclase (GGDEF) domain-containing protein n=1 Tax=Pseudoduganella namucuonensis TaxID=1035707 RepID=A0A1I7LFP5_9BURK|nr:diguanylate cyclase [Pseudoduganella namucuonensis]SFV08492.1 PAS domain S-box-containing protein/diguanylate cyclase (GGDEF) domain-containing protein [Pseudoduganella namucuonensis]
MIRTDNPVQQLLRRLYRVILLPVFAVVLLVSMWAAVVFQVNQEYASSRHEAVLHSQALARTLADHTGHLLRQSDHATQLFKLKYEETGGALRLPEFTRRNGLLDSLMPSKLELPIALYGADGKLVDSQYAQFLPDVADQPFFKTISLSHEDTALAANPMVEPSTKKWQIQISRRLNNRDGDFAGVIMLMIDPAYFVEDYDRLHVEDQGLVMLVSMDTGLAIARVDEKLYISDAIDFTTTIDAAGAGDELVMRRPLDNVARIYSYRDMPRYQLTAVVGNTVRHAMAKFERQRGMYFTVAGAASLLVFGFALLLMRQSQRLSNSMEAATAAQQKLRAAADASLDAVFLLKACRGQDGDVTDFILIDVNERGARMLEHPRDSLPGQRIGELVPNWRREGFIEKYAQVLATGQPLEEEFETRNLPGEPRWLRHQIVAIDDGVAVTTRNITSRKRDELALRKQQAELAAMNDASPLGLIRADANGHCTYVNRTFEKITGLTRAQALGDKWMAAVHPNDRVVLTAALSHLRDTRKPFQDTMRCVHPDGEVVWTSMKVAPIIIDERIEGFVGTLDDITLMRKSVMALRESEARLRTIADTLPAMIAYVDYEEVYRFNNIAYEREFSQSGMDVMGKTVRETVGEARYAFLQPYVRRVLAGETLSFEEDDDSGGVARSFEVNYIPQYDEEGYSVIGFHVMRQDVTARKREKQRLLKLSQVDALTGLVNRAGFLQKLSESMAYCRDNDSIMAVMYMDIDRFKPVNDTYGHSVGDELLKAFSARLTHTMRASDTIARLGGDEFTIIMERIGRREDADALAGKIVQVMQAPFELERATVSVSTSIGLTYYRGEGMTPAELLNRADVLLYQAKQAGRDTFRAGPPIPAPQAASDAA